MYYKADIKEIYIYICHATWQKIVHLDDAHPTNVINARTCSI
jgi:hypothetical protein